MSNNKEPVELAICMGSSCFSRGNKRNIRTIREFIQRNGLCGHVVLKGHLCEGLCTDGPNITVDGEVFHSIDSDSVDIFLDQRLKTQD